MWMRHISRMNKSCRTYEWVMSQVVPHMNESSHTYASTSGIDTWIYHAHLFVRLSPWFVHMCDVTLLYHLLVLHGFESHIWKHIRHRTMNLRKSSTHSYIRYESCLMNGACFTCEWVRSHIWMRHLSHVNESCHTHAGTLSIPQFVSTSSIHSTIQKSSRTARRNFLQYLQFEYPHRRRRRIPQKSCITLATECVKITVALPNDCGTAWAQSVAARHWVRTDCAKMTIALPNDCSAALAQSAAACHWIRHWMW